MKLRFFILIGGTTLAFIFIIYNIYALQIKNGDYYTERVVQQSLAAGNDLASRGTIYVTDKNHSLIPAALNKDYPVIFAVPKEMTDAQEASQKVAQAFGLDAAQLFKKFSNSASQYELLIERATDAQTALVKDLGGEGIYVGSEKARFYPFNSLAAQVLGFVGLSDTSDTPKGKYGIEAQYNGLLAGSAGTFDGTHLTPATPGGNVVLTIDQNIEARAEEILETLVTKFKGVRGSVIVQEPKTGKILAMANYPTFDPNTYSDFPLSHFVNGTVESLYEPGSIVKVLTMAAGIDSGKITPETTYYDNGFLTLNGKTIKNWDLKAHGKLTMTQVIEQSINTGAAFAEKTMGNDIFYDYLLKFGFKQPTGIGLPNEVAGRLTPLERYPRDINFATASFGQGVSLTPLRLITDISAIANGGVLKEPYIAELEPPHAETRVMSEQTARQVTAMMVSAVKKAEIAQIPHYDIAGKTGTALIPDFTHGGYTSNVIDSYAGFAPAYNPQFTILFKIDAPEGAPLAGATVVPAFRELAEFLLNYYNIPPTDVSNASQ